MGRTRSFMKMRKLRSQSTLHTPALPILIANDVYFTTLQRKTNMLPRELVPYHAYKSVVTDLIIKICGLIISNFNNYRK